MGSDGNTVIFSRVSDVFNKKNSAGPLRGERAAAAATPLLYATAERQNKKRWFLY